MTRRRLTLMLTDDEYAALRYIADRYTSAETLLDPRAYVMPAESGEFVLIALDRRQVRDAWEAIPLADGASDGPDRMIPLAGGTLRTKLYRLFNQAGLTEGV